jgi:hypothetical protein
VTVMWPLPLSAATGPAVPRNSIDDDAVRTSAPAGVAQSASIDPLDVRA